MTTPGTDIAVPAPAGIPATIGGDLYTSLERWAQAATAAHGMAEKLVVTSFVPEAYRNKPHEATAAILAGAEMGLSPMASLKAFDVINGTAAPRAITLRAVVQSRGHRMWEVEVTAERVVVQGQRRGESVIHESVWDLERAKGLKLLGKDNWVKQPKAMLLARATAECARMVAADAILGIAYSAEEIADGDSAAANPLRVEAQTGAPVRVTAADILDGPAPAPDPEPATVDAAPSEAAAEPTTVDADGQVAIDVTGASPRRPITPDQRARLAELLKATGRNGRTTAAKHISALINREIALATDLFEDEAVDVIDALSRDAAAKTAPAEGQS